MPTQVLADQLTLSQPKRADYAHPALASFVTDTIPILYGSFVKYLKKMYEHENKNMYSFRIDFNPLLSSLSFRLYVSNHNALSGKRKFDLNLTRELTEFPVAMIQILH